MKDHQPFLENPGHFVLKTAFLLAMLSDFEREAALQNPIF